MRNWIVGLGFVAVFCSVVALGFLVVPAAHAEGYQIVANAGVGVSSLTKDQATQMFLRRLPKWPDGKAVVPVDLVKTSTVRETFSKAVHGRGAAAIVAYWQQQVFSGGDVPPAEKGSDAEVLAFVKATPGAIGYVAADASLGEGVKAISVK